MTNKKDVSESKRHLRVAESLKRTISEALNQEKLLVHVIGDIHVTVSEVRLSPDFKSSRIYVLPQNKPDAPEIISLMNEYSWEFNKYLSKQTNLKFLPKLHFIYDDLFDKIQNIDSLLDSIDE